MAFGKFGKCEPFHSKICVCVCVCVVCVLLCMDPSGLIQNKWMDIFGFTGPCIDNRIYKFRVHVQSVKVKVTFGKQKQ